MHRNTDPDVQKALTFYLGSRVLNEILDMAVEATGARDWGGNTGCFAIAFKTFEETWDELLEAGCELSLACAKSIGEAIIQGTTVEQTRLGRAWVTPVRKHIKEHWHEAPTLEDPMIHDMTSVGSIWNTFRTLFEASTNSAIPDSLLEQDFA